MTAEELRALDGQSVLVKPSRPGDKNSVGMRGSLKVVTSMGADPREAQVELVVQWPDMFTQRAEARSVILTNDEVAQLLREARDGTCTLVCDRVLDSPGAALKTSADEPKTAG
ncbi:hypothetical protein K0B96_05865 [Horticoccus luteus]|uniref:Uncharacterized protein n=1 Tax=Horticoccus luteus TaxID=2862869 RepID=A0A8F9XI80_9BACT|nr:hypothetical protein [Horticoccus luteus]QYM80140.1 hypothetical protein K0B96_05865 [Horticoccus luteus]